MTLRPARTRVAMRRGAAVALVAVAMAVLTVPAVARTSANAAAACPSVPTAAQLSTRSQLRDAEEMLASLKMRATGSPQQSRYLRWIRRQLAAIPGLHISELRYPIQRWTSTRTSLTMTVHGRATHLDVADAVPYSLSTGNRGISAPAVYIPDSQQITADNALGKIVVRDAPAGSVPNGAFFLPAVSWEVYDPGHTIDPTGTFYGDFINYNARVTDLRDAAAAGAAGVLFVKPLPTAQIAGHYEPYEGEQWNVPGLFLGADEGLRITDAISRGEHPVLHLVDAARVGPVVTPSIEAVLPGRTGQRIVIDSHTDGTNANEDNGPIAMVAMARWAASLPLACRPRTLQFAFSTAHFYQRVGPDTSVRDGGAEQLAEQLDRDYDRGTVSAVVVLEHLGAKDYQQQARGSGRPGFSLEPTGLPAIRFIGVTPSPLLVAAVDQIVRGYDLRRTIVLQGADLPAATNPAHCTFGGEGTPYERHLLPTVGVISAPQYLYDPAFEFAVLDLPLMQREIAAYTALVAQLQTMSQADIAGAVDTERQLRALGAPGCPSDGT